MRIAILGSGIIGASTAWWLNQAGHEVVVIDERGGPAQGASRAGSGQISVSHAEPWAHSGAPARLIRGMFEENASLLFRARLDPRQWWWAMQFLRECVPGRLTLNVRALVKMAEYSHQTLKGMRAEFGLDQDFVQRGTLNFYRDDADLESAQKMADVMRDFGVDRRLLSPDEVVALEPALAPIRARLAGGDYIADEETGDAYQFTLALTERAREAGVEFRYATQLTRLVPGAGRVQNAEVIDADGLYQTLKADAYVAALGCQTPQFMRPLGIPCSVYPAKVWSASFTVRDELLLPEASLIDSAHQVSYTRMGHHLRMAGGAELSGYSQALNTLRCNNMLRQAQDLFPNALDFDNVRFWSGLQPATPSSVPLVGRTQIPNLYLNTGHGTLGWTMAAGSGRALADLISGHQPEPDFPFLG